MFSTWQFLRPFMCCKTCEYDISKMSERIVSYLRAIWNIPVILLRNYGGGSIILPPDNAVWLYALPYIYLSCVDSVAELNRTTQKISTTTVVVRFITAFASLIQR